MRLSNKEMRSRTSMEETTQHSICIMKALVVDWTCAENGKLMNTQNRHYCTVTWTEGLGKPGEELWRGKGGVWIQRPAECWYIVQSCAW